MICGLQTYYVSNTYNKRIYNTSLLPSVQNIRKAHGDNPKYILRLRVSESNREGCGEYNNK